MSVSTFTIASGGSGMEALLRQDAQRLQQQADALAGPVDAAAGAGSSGFESILRRVDDQQQQASDRMEAVERGESDDLVGAMLSSQQASLSFSMLMQVRNKVVGAVDELIKMQL